MSKYVHHNAASCLNVHNSTSFQEVVNIQVIKHIMAAPMFDICFKIQDKWVNNTEKLLPENINLCKIFSQYR